MSKSLDLHLFAKQQMRGGCLYGFLLRFELHRWQLHSCSPFSPPGGSPGCYDFSIWEGCEGGVSPLADDVCNIPCHFWFTPLLLETFLKTPKKSRKSEKWNLEAWTNMEQYGNWQILQQVLMRHKEQSWPVASNEVGKNHRPRYQRRCCTSREFPPNSALPQVKTRPFTKMAANAPQDAANFTTLLISNNSERRSPGEVSVRGKKRHWTVKWKNHKKSRFLMVSQFIGLSFQQSCRILGFGLII